MDKTIIAVAEGHKLANALTSGGEAGLFHLRACSQVVKTKIRVWDKAGNILGIFYNRDNDVINLNKKQNRCNRKIFLNNSSTAGNFLELEYENFDNGKLGHWIAKGGEDLETSGNNCLFNAICQQGVGFEAQILRQLTADAIRNEKFVYEKLFTQYNGAGCFLLGGAKYDGKSAESAKILLDNSQGTCGYGHSAKAHPRGHASHADANEMIDSVEKYSQHASKDFPKSAWLSRSDQDTDMHRLLLCQDSQDGMRDLNSWATRSSKETRISKKIKPWFEIKMGLWAEGAMFCGPINADEVVIVLQHHLGKENEPDAEVQVFTCFPVSHRCLKNLNQLMLLKPLKLKRSLSPDDPEEKSKKLKIDNSK